MVSEARVSIGQVKRDISELVNRVAYGDERVVLTSRGRPKAVLVSVEDYEKLRQVDAQERTHPVRRWLADLEEIHRDVLARRGGVPIDVDQILRSEEEDREERDSWTLGGH